MSVTKITRERSILDRMDVLRSVANGAPPVPWMLRHEDREVMERLASYFAQAIPVPTKDGRVTVTETVGYSGPQLELYVPVLSSKSPVAVLARNWHAGRDLEADLFFFGASGGRLAAIVLKLGFVSRGSHTSGATVFQQLGSGARKLTTSAYVEAIGG